MKNSNSLLENWTAAFAYVPWGHHIAIITKCRSVEEAVYYIRRTIEEGWSRSASYK